MAILLIYVAYAPLQIVFSRQAYRLLLLYSLSFSELLSAEDVPVFDSYRPGAAALIEEFHAESDDFGSMLPSVLSWQGINAAETLIDFERGLITISATWTEPALAAEIANQVAEGYIKLLFDQAIDDALRDQNYLSERLMLLKEDVRVAEQKLQDKRGK